MKRKQKFPNQTVERLTALRGILNMHERAIKAKKSCRLNGVSRRFDLTFWDCGTAACAVGSCALNPWFKERGFHLKKRIPQYGALENWDAVTIFFGITELEADNVFSMYGYSDNHNPVAVRDRVDQLIEKYSK